MTCGCLRPHLLGVVGHDVRLDDLVIGGFSADQILEALVLRSRTCTRLQLSVCELQVLSPTRGSLSTS